MSNLGQDSFSVALIGGSTNRSWDGSVKWMGCLYKAVFSKFLFSIGLLPGARQNFSQRGKTARSVCFVVSFVLFSSVFSTRKPLRHGPTCLTAGNSLLSLDPEQCCPVPRAHAAPQVPEINTVTQAVTVVKVTTVFQRTLYHDSNYGKIDGLNLLSRRTVRTSYILCLTSVPIIPQTCGIYH